MLYQIYLIGKFGQFTDAHVVDCDDDEAAMKAARQFVDGKDLQIWQGARPIGSIPSPEKHEQSNQATRLSG